MRHKEEISSRRVLQEYSLDLNSFLESIFQLKRLEVQQKEEI